MRGKIYCCKMEDLSGNPNISSEIINSLFENVILVSDHETGRNFHQHYTKTKREALAFVSQIRKLVPELVKHGIIISNPEIAMLKNEDWAESWKKYFDIIKLTDRLVIKPGWLEYKDPAPGEIVLEIDPGMSFGTGKHPTTQFCLQLIEESRTADDRQSLIDVGCGSGILMLAGLKLGYTPVIGIDNDSEALETSAENFRKNNVKENSYELHCANFANFKSDRKYDVVAANILSMPLIEHRKSLISLLEPGGILILSGILFNEYQQVRKIYEACGLSEVKFLTDENWAGASFRWNI